MAALDGSARRFTALSFGVIAVCLAASAASCGGDDPATSAADGTGGFTASSSSGNPSNTGSTGGHSGSTGPSMLVTSSSGTGGGGTVACTTPCDAATEICSHGVCVAKATCTTDDDCKNDTTCDADGTCQPWAGHMPADDPACVNLIVPGIFSPKVKCEFSKAPDGDPFPGNVDVQTTPIVMNFNGPASSGVPSIASAFATIIPGSWSSNVGIIRVLRGDDCTLEANLGGVDLDGDGVVDYVDSSASLAAGDLDGDGVPEIVAYGTDGATLAFTKKAGVWSLLWKAPLPAGAPWTACGNTCSLGWAGPAIHDLDDDGKPEVIREGVVFSGAGAVLSMQPTGYGSYSQGLLPVLANLDDDPSVEFTNGKFIWKWTGGAWSTGAPLGPTAGFTAVANFGAYGTGPASDAEVAVVSGGMVTVYALDGTVVMPSTAVPPGTGNGGPPTIADFDGDGQPEVAVAGKDYYTVYDLDCGPTPRPGGHCPNGPCDFASDGKCPPYIAWSRSSQDHSSDISGSSVFDFEGDGKAEVVYADECFVRVYDGTSGEVIFSQYHSSCTWYEYPVVADTDGDFRADLVTPSNKACAPAGQDSIACSKLDANGVDAQFAGLHCKKDADCYSGTCDMGLCRCTAGAECCAAADDAACLEEGFACVPPPAGTAGTGNTCRAAHPHGVSGIRVYADAHDKWVRSRPVWNEHAYSVTNVNDDGTIPKTSDWKRNWDDPKLNNFRQNVPGTQNGNATGDLTAGASDTVTCGGDGTATLKAPICNRGSDPVAAGLSVGFYVAGASVCEGATTKTLQPGECQDVTCDWASAPTTSGAAVDVTVTPNDMHAYAECKKGNNDGVILGVFCKPIG